VLFQHILFHLDLEFSPFDPKSEVFVSCPSMHHCRKFVDNMSSLRHHVNKFKNCFFLAHSIMARTFQGCQILSRTAENQYFSILAQRSIKESNIWQYDKPIGPLPAAFCLASSIAFCCSRCFFLNSASCCSSHTASNGQQPTALVHWHTTTNSNSFSNICWYNADCVNASGDTPVFYNVLF